MSEYERGRQDEYADIVSKYNLLTDEQAKEIYQQGRADAIEDFIKSFNSTEFELYETNEEFLQRIAEQIKEQT